MFSAYYFPVVMFAGSYWPGTVVQTLEVPTVPSVHFHEHDLKAFKITSNPHAAARVQFNWLWSYTKEYFNRQPETVILGEVGKRRANLNLWYVRDGPTKNSVVAAAVDLRKESVKYIQFQLSVQHYRLIDQQVIIGITHYEGIEPAGGWVRKPFRIVSMALDADMEQMSIGIVASSA